MDVDLRVFRENQQCFSELNQSIQSKVEGLLTQDIQQQLTHLLSTYHLL